MRKLASRASLAATALAVVVVAACNFKADFILTKTFAPVVATSGAAFGGSRDVDLAAEAPGAWKRRDDLKSLDLVALEAQVYRNATPATVSGTLVLSRPSFGPDVEVGRWTNVNVPVATVDAPFVFDVTLSPGGSALIMDAIKDDGKFTVRATASTASAIDVDLKVLLHVGINYHMGP